jgi:hypothetical protein
MQALLHAVMWIHPAAAFVARTLDREREIACDEWVVARTGLPRAYARCLTRAAEVRGRITSTRRRRNAALGPALLERRQDLERRIGRLLAIRGRTRPRMSRLAASSGASVLLALATQLHSVPLVAELGESPFPSVPPVASALRGMTSFGPDEGTLLNGPDGVNWLNAPAALAVPIVPRAPVVFIAATDGAESGRLVVPAPPDTAAALEASNASVAPVLQSRSFPALQPAAFVWQVLQVGTASGTPWQRAASAGVRVGEIFTRAGESVARRF